MYSASQRICGYQTPDESFAQFCRVQDRQLLARPKHLRGKKAPDTRSFLPLHTVCCLGIARTCCVRDTTYLYGARRVVLARWRFSCSRRQERMLLAWVRCSKWARLIMRPGSKKRVASEPRFGKPRGRATSSILSSNIPASRRSPFQCSWQNETEWS